MGRRVPDYNNQANYDERLRNRYRWGAAYGISIFAGIALAGLAVNVSSQFLLPADVALLFNMGLLVLAMVNQYRLPPFHIPGEQPDVGIVLQLWRLQFISILLAPFSFSLACLLDLTMGSQGFQVGVIMFFAVAVMAIVILVINSRYPSPMR